MMYVCFTKNENSVVFNKYSELVTPSARQIDNQFNDFIETNPMTPLKVCV